LSNSKFSEFFCYFSISSFFLFSLQLLCCFLMLITMWGFVRWDGTRLKGFCNPLECYSKGFNNDCNRDQLKGLCNPPDTIASLIGQLRFNRVRSITKSVTNLFTPSHAYLPLHSGMKFTINSCHNYRINQMEMCRGMIGMYNSYARPWQSGLQSILQLVQNRTDFLRISIVIWVNCWKIVNEHFNYINEVMYSVWIARISIQFDLEFDSTRLGTDSHNSTKLV
jgi:hypothetical protein